MNYAQLKELVVEELGQPNGIDRFLDRWIQQSIDLIYGKLPFEATLRSGTITTTADTETVPIPDDHGETVSLIYTPGDGSGYKLTEVTPDQFFTNFPDQITSSFVNFFTVYDGLIYMSPIPADAYTLTLRYRISSSNIFLHQFNIEDDNNAANVGVAVYLDEDDISSVKQIGKLYFISPTSLNAKISLNDLDGHKHEVTIFHSDDAVSLGRQLYLDEDISTFNKRLLFVSPTGKDTVVQVNTSRNHSHFIKITDNDDAATDGIAVYCDEDVADKTKRIRFVSPTDVDGTSEVVPSLNELLPPFVEQYQEGIVLAAVTRGFRRLKNYDAMATFQSGFKDVMKSYEDSEDRKTSQAVEAKPFSSVGKGIWDSLRFPQIDD